MDKEEKLRFRRALVWHPAIPATTSTIPTRFSPRTGQCKGAYNALARPGTKDCKAYNHHMCSKDSTHAGQQHICAYYLSTVKQAFPHPEQLCNRKPGADAKNA